MTSSYYQAIGYIGYNVKKIQKVVTYQKYADALVDSPDNV